MRYQDRHRNEIAEGMYLRSGDGSVERAYVWQTGDGSDLGINASNETYLQVYGLGKFPQELYPLSKSGLLGVEICGLEVEPWQLGMMGQSVCSGNVSPCLTVCAALTDGVGLGYYWQEWRPSLASVTEYYMGRQMQVRLGRKWCRLRGLCCFRNIPPENIGQQSCPGILV